MARAHMQASETDNPCNCTALRKATRRVSQLYDAALAPSGMKTTQRAILTQINRSDRNTIGTLAEELVMDSGALTHTLKPLERDGFVTITPDPDDRRTRLIKLTRKGQAKLEETNALWLRAQVGFETAFGKSQSGTLRQVMRLLVSADFAAAYEKAIMTPQPPQAVRRGRT